MEPELDDTRIAVPRPVVRPEGADFDDTVAREAVPPALVEPPAPEARPIAVVAPPVGPPPPVVSSEAPAPVRALLPDGTVVDLDGVMYIGRRPSVPRISPGVVPRLVTIPSPLRELSATHLELRVVGSTLVASDMRSTNGTVVQLPGAAPRTLIRGESAVVVPGTRIDLGEGAVIDILPPHEKAET